MLEITIYSDGAARGNPGLSGAGAVLSDTEGKVVGEVCKYLGDNLTNNQAEYRALILALGLAVEKGGTHLKVFADSELMVKQINGEYRVKNEGIKPLHQEIKKLLTNFVSYKVAYVPREKNKHADRLANLAIDGQVM